MGKWKDKYKDSWEVSTKREKRAKSLIENFGYKLITIGFLAESQEYSKEHPKEKGIPDYWIENTNIYIEVTGTNSKNVKEQYPIWVRPDKVEYALNHTDKECWLVHIIDALDLIRMIKLDRCQYAPVQTKLGDEKYHIVPADQMINPDTFKERIKDGREIVPN